MAHVHHPNQELPNPNPPVQLRFISTTTLQSLSPTQFSGLTALSTLDLGVNPGYWRCPSDVVDGFIKGGFCVTPCALNGIRIRLLDEVAAPRTCRELNLNDNSIVLEQGSNLTYRFPSLQTLRLRNNHISSLPLEIFSGLAALFTVNLVRNPISYLRSSAFEGIAAGLKLHFGNVPKLQVFEAIPNDIARKIEVDVVIHHALNCSVGWYQGSQTFASSTVTVCRQCETGYYCPAGPRRVACPVGRYSEGPGADSQSSCLPCPAGTYNPVVAGTSVSSCVFCPAGRASPDLAATNISFCQDCAPGYFAISVGNIGCEVCPAGKFSELVGSGSSQNCKDCPLGLYGNANANERYSMDEACKMCPPGFFTSREGSSSVNECQPPSCSVGEEPVIDRSINNATCVNCPEGYTSGGGRSQCVPCQRGRYQPVGKRTCSLCPPLTFNPAVATNGLSSCKACLPGLYATASREACEACPSGFILDSNRKCIPCDVRETCLPGFPSAVTAPISLLLDDGIRSDVLDQVSSFVRVTQDESPIDATSDNGSSGVVMLSVLSCGVVVSACIGILPTKLRNLLLKVDIFADDHPLDEGEALTKRSTYIGGALTIMVASTLLALTYQLVAAREANNITLNSALSPISPGGTEGEAVGVRTSFHISINAVGMLHQSSCVEAIPRKSVHIDGFVGDVSLSVDDANTLSDKANIRRCVVHMFCPRPCSLTAERPGQVKVPFPWTMQLLSATVSSESYTTGGNEKSKPVESTIHAAMSSPERNKSISSFTLRYVATPELVFVDNNLEGTRYTKFQSGSGFVMQFDSSEYSLRPSRSTDQPLEATIELVRAKTLLEVQVKERVPVLDLISSMFGLAAGVIGGFRFLFVAVEFVATYKRRKFQRTRHGQKVQMTVTPSGLRSRHFARVRGGPSHEDTVPVPAEAQHSGNPHESYPLGAGGHEHSPTSTTTVCSSHQRKWRWQDGGAHSKRFSTKINTN